jgi:splicing factor 3A subunit 3
VYQSHLLEAQRSVQPNGHIGDATFCKMVLEEQRNLHEDIERLEQAIADRYVDEPKQDRYRLNRDHEMAQLLDNLHSQTTALLEIYETRSEERTKEIQDLSLGDSFANFQKQVSELKEYHKRYPNQAAENLEIAYRKPAAGEGDRIPLIINGLFTGEEFYGRYFDMYDLHEQYLNLPSLKTARRIPYLKYLDSFDDFSTIKTKDKLSDAYLQYVRNLTTYLEGFLKKTRPLENLDRLFAQFEDEFEMAWNEGQVPGWEEVKTGPQNNNSTYCDVCEKEFHNENVYQHHFNSKKHIKNAERKNREVGATNGTTNGTTHGTNRLREKAIAEREFRIRKLSAAMQTQRSDTRDNVERRAAMTERERAQELEALNEDRIEMEAQNGPEDEDDDNEKIYNPLKLPLDWTGKPIPFWLYKLHGLGVEFECEVCGNFTYMGRRAFDKHFNESRHVYGLKCLGITSSPLFRDITHIEEAQRLWTKIQKNKRQDKSATDNIVQMEDTEGNVMPEKVFHDLQKQGLI